MSLGGLPHPALKTRHKRFHARITRYGLIRLARSQAARTALMNLATSVLRWVLSRASDCAEDNTCADATPASPAPRLTSVMLLVTCTVPVAACWTLREISWVEAPCSSTAAAMAPEIPEIRPMVLLIALMAGAGLGG